MDEVDSNRGGKASKGQKNNADEDGSSEEIDEDEFKDLRLKWQEFLENQGKGGGNKADKGKDKKKKKKGGEEAGDDEDQETDTNINGLGLNISPWEEDPVQKEFMLDIACSEADKELERQRKEERKAALTNILRKVQKIQDSLTKSSDIDYQ